MLQVNVHEIYGRGRTLDEKHSIRSLELRMNVYDMFRGAGFE